MYKTTGLDCLSLEVLTSIFRTSPLDNVRIINREGSTIEFKESFSFGSMAQYFKTIASFANNSGGYIIFGVGDKPRRLIGLKEKSIQQFETLKVELLTHQLNEYFSPEIRWAHCTFNFRDMLFGVIYVYQLSNKPCICKKNYEQKDPKYTLREGDIYYRYSGRSQKIKFPELNKLIEESRKTEQRDWIKFINRAVKIGVTNACLLDLNSGKLSSNNNSIVLDESLISKIAFIKEGEFCEERGKPTLRIIGDIVNVESGKIINDRRTHRVIKAIEPYDIINAFFNSEHVSNPVEHIKRICFEQSPNYPIFFFIKQSNLTTEQVVKEISTITARGSTKHNLVKRLEGSLLKYNQLKNTNTEAYRVKKSYKDAIISHTKIDMQSLNLYYFLQAILSFSNEEIEEHRDYLLHIMKGIYFDNYESVKSNIASLMRKTICRIDEVLYY